MKSLLAAVLLVALVAGLAPAQEQGKVEFANYYVVFAERGPTWRPQTDQRGMDVRMAVIENLEKALTENDEVIIAGLVNDESGAEFIMILETEDEMAMRERLQESRNVANGFFNLRIHSWRAPAGLKLEMIPRQ
jgi:hypothetical protein